MTDPDPDPYPDRGAALPEFPTIDPPHSAQAAPSRPGLSARWGAR